MNNRNTKYWNFFYNYDIEQLKKFILFSPEEKLQWIEKYFDFLKEAMFPQAKEIWQKYRSGELKSPYDKK